MKLNTSRSNQKKHKFPNCNTPPTHLPGKGRYEESPGLS